jgi:hypothetical protein
MRKVQEEHSQIKGRSQSRAGGCDAVVGRLQMLYCREADTRRPWRVIIRVYIINYNELRSCVAQLLAAQGG